ncbi:MAG: hypothetical protein ACRDDZ_11105 [Marinifilaceae bacterium]
MAYVNTGKQRSLTLELTKKVNGQIIPGYDRKLYDGRLEFTHNGATFPAITDAELASMMNWDYNNRLNFFKAYVESRESGLNIDNDTIAGYEAYKENTNSCPIGV